MKAKRIALTQEQTDACQEYFEMATKRHEAGKTGAIIAQVCKLNDGSGVMIINFADNGLMKLVAEYQGRQLELLTDITVYPAAK